MKSRIVVRDTVFDVAEEVTPFWAAVMDGSWEPSTFDVLSHFLKPDWRFVDIGAWIGPTALFAARRCRTVEAYECDPIAIACLERNIAANPEIAAKISLRPYALGDADGFIKLYSKALGNSETSIFQRHERDGALVECGQSILAGVRDARDVFRDHGYASCARTLIKIDVEGAEFRIIPRLADLIEESRCAWYVSFHELNINSRHLPSRFARIAEMLRTFECFGNLRWFGSNLHEIDKAAVLDGIVDGRWPPHGAMIFRR